MEKGIYCTHLKKVVYPHNRRFLPANHELRSQYREYPEKFIESRPKPPTRNFKQDLVFHSAYDKAINEAQRKRIGTGTGCRGSYVLADKNPQFDRVHQTVPDAMHTIAVQMKHLVRCMAGKESEDSLAVRKLEQELNRFEESWVHYESNTASSSKKSLQSAPFGLSKKECEEADRRTTEIVTPEGDTFVPKPIFGHISKLNSHHWKEVNYQLLPLYTVLLLCYLLHISEKHPKTFLVSYVLYSLGNDLSAG